LQILFENSDVDLKVYSEKISNRVLSHSLISDKWGKTGRWGLATTIRKDEFINILNIIKEGTEDWQLKLKSHLNKILERINEWFDSVMDRTSQSFIRQTRFWTVIFSVIVAFVLHLDMIRLFEQISSDAELRASLIASSEAILNQADDVVGKSSVIPAVYSESVLRLKLQDTTGIAKKLGDPPMFASREEGENWIREQLSEEGQVEVDSLVYLYSEIINTDLKNSLEKMKDRAYSIKDELEKTKLQLIPSPYPGWDYSPGEKHFWGVLIMAAFLSLGAPFWFKALKTLSALRPILATKEDKEKKGQEEKG
jgi:hypothetical protein